MAYNPEWMHRIGDLPTPEPEPDPPPDDHEARIAALDSFREFVEAPPLEGLGTTLEDLKALCRDTPAAIDAIDKAEKAGSKPGPKSTDDSSVYNIHRTIERPAGTSSAAALRRLRKDRPDLHAQVLAGEKSVNTAMIEAGLIERVINCTGS